MTVREATFTLLGKLRMLYAEAEASSITDMVMEHVTGSQKTERMLYKNAALLPEEEAKLNKITERLQLAEPVQYILQEAWFGGFRFYVDRHVLIPRPETDELVEWIISNCRFPISELNILDIGTGSGCIAVTLKRRLRKAEVWACDISPQALAVAQKNAGLMNVDITFRELNFLNRAEWPQLPLFDIIVSNPPYVPERDKATIHRNVLDYEPHTALFVQDDDPLLFYKALAEFGRDHLKPGGSIFCEIHEQYGISTQQLFVSAGYRSEIKKDMQQKDRMLRSGLAEI